MDMARHKTVCVDFKAFVFLTIPDAVNNDSAILITNKNVNPVNDGEGHKIEAGLIVDFILSTHSMKTTVYKRKEYQVCVRGAWEEIRKKCLFC